MSLPSFHAALDVLDELFVTFDERGHLREWNQVAVEVTGHTAAELDELAVDDLFADDTDRVRVALARVAESGRATVEADLVTADGDRLPYELRLVRLPDGAETGDFAGIGRDITQPTGAMERQREVLDRMTDAFFAVDENWRFTYVNHHAVPILAAAMGRDGVEADDLVGLQLWEEIPVAVGTPFHEQYHEAMRTQTPVSFEEYYAPLEMWLEVRAYPSETGLSVYFHDITQQRRQREALTERERVLREMYTIIADRDRTFTEQVEALLALGRDVLNVDYGTLSRVQGSNYIFEVVEAADERIAAGDVVPLSDTNCEVAVSTEQTLVLGDIERDAPELTDRAGYAEWGIACYLGAPVFVDDDVYGTFCFYDTNPRREQFTEWHVALVDLMSRWVSYELERQRASERLEQQNTQLEQFASIVSHDLRNPLNVLQGRLELAEETGDPEQFDRCQQAIDRMDDLIGDLLALARAGRLIDETTTVDLPSLVDRAWRSVDTKSATLEVETDQSVEADEARLQQLVENLLRNAVVHGGETVTVSVGALDDGFYVADDGPGIPEDVREQVFEGGYTTLPDGTGFGLAIVKQIADAHGWDVRATEGPAGGARIEFTGVDVAA